jgi:5'/3'-nucleotidase
LRILVTNDDGVHSKGLHLLARRLKSVGEVTVIAPDRERNAASHALTLHKPLRVERLGDGLYGVNGTPTDCVNLGANALLDQRPDLVVSGINKGGNLGDDVTYSGTVSAAIEGTLLGIPSFAVSLLNDGEYHFSTAAEFAVYLARLIGEQRLPKDTLLNVNVPNLPISSIRGVKVTCLGKRIYDRSNIVAKTDPRGRAYYWIGANETSWEDRKDTDDLAIRDKMISVTPIHLDLTNYAVLDRLRAWEPLLSKKIQRRRRGKEARKP